MNAQNIFKMEMYKNATDKPYLFIVGILTALSAIVSVLGVVVIQDTLAVGGSRSLGWFPITFFILVLTFFGLGVAIFGLIYPFRLLNVDYSNKVISLMFASGVNRVQYYLVKVGATILSNMFAMLTIMIIPLLTFLSIYRQAFLEFLNLFIENVTTGELIRGGATFTLSVVSGVVVMACSVILTRGKIAGIFLYIGFNFAIQTVSTVISILMLPFSQNQGLVYASSGSIFSPGQMIIPFLSIVIFGLLGIYLLRRQDL